MSHASTVAGEPSAPAPVASLRLWAPLVVALTSAAAHGLFLVLPYYANHLDRYPLEDVAVGYHDPKGLWPNGTALGTAFALGGLVTVALAPLVACACVPWAGVTWWLGRSPRVCGALLLSLTTAVVVSTLAWRASTFGTAPMHWFLE